MQDNQQKQLYIELTPEQAATVEGGTVWVGSTTQITFQYWDKATQSWGLASSGPGAPWQYGGPGETTSISYDYVAGPGLDAYTTKDLVADNYYVLDASSTNPNWYETYLSDPTFTQKVSLVGHPVGTPAATPVYPN